MQESNPHRSPQLKRSLNVASQLCIPYPRWTLTGLNLKIPLIILNSSHLNPLFRRIQSGRMQESWKPGAARWSRAAGYCTKVALDAMTRQHKPIFPAQSPFWCLVRVAYRFWFYNLCEAFGFLCLLFHLSNSDNNWLTFYVVVGRLLHLGNVFLLL